jgi:hypothetical protein
MIPNTNGEKSPQPELFLDGLSSCRFFFLPNERFDDRRQDVRLTYGDQFTGAIAQKPATNSF